MANSDGTKHNENSGTLADGSGELATNLGFGGTANADASAPSGSDTGKPSSENRRGKPRGPYGPRKPKLDASGSATADAPAAAKRRTRPAPAAPDAATEAAPPKPVPLNASALVNEIFGMHAIGAQMLGVPEFALTPAEAEMLANRIAKLSEFYNLNSNSPFWAIVSLLGVCGIIYIPRGNMIMAKRRANKARPATVAPEPNLAEMSPRGYDFSGMDKAA